MRLFTLLLLLTSLTIITLADDIPSSEIVNLVSHRQIKNGKLTINDTITIQINGLSTFTWTV